MKERDAWKAMVGDGLVEEWMKLRQEEWSAAVSGLGRFLDFFGFLGEASAFLNLNSRVLFSLLGL